MNLLGKGLLDGMLVTARNFIGSYFDKERLVTVQYPEERVVVPENSRTFPFLVYDGTPDHLRCTACKICETECPPQCIYIVMDRDEKGKPRQRPQVFDIDISVCMQCEICVEVCPFDAIKMDNDYEKARLGRFEDLVERLPDLLKPNEYYHQVKPTEATAVDAALQAAAERKAKKAAAPKVAVSTAPAPPPAAVVKPPGGTDRGDAVPPSPGPLRAAAVTLKVAVPQDVLSAAEQEAWRRGFSGLPTKGAVPIAPAAAPSTTAPPLTATPAPASTPSGEAPAGGWPWHDAGLTLAQRLALAKDRPLADKLMAAMAQSNCNACGYDCRGYADALASGTETDVTLCLAGEAETEAALRQMLKEAGKLA